MVKPAKLYALLLQSSNRSVSFRDFERLLRAFGFEWDRTTGSHRQYCHINLFWSGGDKCWIADVPDLRPCSAHGDTREQAVSNIRDAIEGWLEVAREKGFPIPEPRYRLAIYAAR